MEHEIDPKSVTVAPFLSLKSRYRSYALAVSSSSPFAFSRAISSALVRATSAAVARAHPIMSTHTIRKKRSFHVNGCCG